MCVAIYKPKETILPSLEILKQCWDANPDGAGFALRTDGEYSIGIHKGYMTWKQFVTAYEKYHLADFEGDLLLHFRIATHGGISPGLTHPFSLTKDVKLLKHTNVRTNYALIHNGMLPIESEEGSDTMEFCRRLAPFYQNIPSAFNLIEGMAGNNKISVMTRDKVHLFGEWERLNGVYFSNLAAMLLPALNQARERARAAQCINNKKQAMLGQIQYAGDYGNVYVGYVYSPDSSFGMWAAVLSNGQEDIGWFTKLGLGYISPANCQCPSAQNKISANVNEISSAWGSFYFSSIFGIDYSDMWGDRQNTLGNYVMKGGSSAQGDEHHLLNLGKMQLPSATVVFADTAEELTGTPSNRFYAYDDYWGAGVVEIHSGRTSVAFADGHAGLHTGLELKGSVYNLSRWKDQTYLPRN